MLSDYCYRNNSQQSKKEKAETIPKLHTVKMFYINYYSVIQIGRIPSDRINIDIDE